MGAQVAELGLEGRVLPGGAIGAFEVEDQRHQRFGDEAAAERAEAAVLVGAGPQAVGPRHLHYAPAPTPARRGRPR